MKILTRDETISALPFDGLIPALDAGFRDTIEAPLRHHHSLANDDAPDDTLLLMPAWAASGWGGVKLVNVHPGNGALGRPAVTATYILFDRETGEHVLMLDGGELTARRTVAASALAAKRLARPDSRRLLLVGAGRIGSASPHAFRSVLPIETVEVWNRSAEGAERLVDQLREEGFDARPAPDLAEAVGRADIVSCATLASEPILKGEWLRPGQHVDLIGSFRPDMREADDEVMRRARVFIDTDHARKECGDIRTPIETGVLAEEDIAGTLVDLCRADAYPRACEDEITLFKGVGSAIEDLSAAILAAREVL
ncbi:ornithine cyclodeaminase family protein [Fulvimarina endophytica]|uniref:Ornithine cyclodeaminase family protein n=1 Tax=Fulvimarina endophytica TaxID=2293836 RepID=A0A371WYU4_9HYPH|nr:ornithine cyclodeaminase family protein [Fulvimarina endophytica]RFC62106.1 ornithine cyclodeaminase family protein [Fulvimarina endophytica]